MKFVWEFYLREDGEFMEGIADGKIPPLAPQEVVDLTLRNWTGPVSFDSPMEATESAADLLAGFCDRNPDTTNKQRKLVRRVAIRVVRL